MSDLIEQFFGDAKRVKLTSAERSAIRSALTAHMHHEQISPFAQAQALSLNSLEKAEALENLMGYVKRNPIERVPLNERIGKYFTFHRFAAAAFSLILFIGAGGGMTYAAESAMPNDILYPVKVHINERMWAAVHFTPERKADWEAKRIERRLQEAEHLSQADKLTPEWQQRLRVHIEARADFLEERLQQMPTERRAEVEDRVRAAIEKHDAILEVVEGHIPAPEVVREFRENVRAVHKRFPGKKPGLGIGRPGGANAGMKTSSELSARSSASSANSSKEQSQSSAASSRGSTSSKPIDRPKIPGGLDRDPPPNPLQSDGSAENDGELPDLPPINGLPPR